MSGRVQDTAGTQVCRGWTGGALRPSGWCAAGRASPTAASAQSLFKFMSTESGMLFNHLILCHPLLLLTSVLPSTRIFFICGHWPDNKTPGQLGSKAPAAGGVGAAASCLALCRPLPPCLHPQGLGPPFASSPTQATTSAHLRDRTSANALLENRPWPCDFQARPSC